MWLFRILIPSEVSVGFPPTPSCSVATLLQSHEHGLGDLDILNSNAGKVGNRQLIVGCAAR